MAYKKYIPQSLLDKYPQYTREEIRDMINIVWKSVRTIMRSADTFKINLKDIGTLRSHANKQPKRLKKTRKYDVKRKRKLYKEQSLSKEKLLF